jgi:hypothetical protein
MIDTRRTRSPLAFGFAAVGVVTAAYAVALVAGCGSGQEAPPSTATQAQAEGATPGAGGAHHRHMPPPAAFDACKDKAVGAACTVTLHDDEIAGKCEAPPEGSSQTTPACRPEGGPRHRPHGPPPEIVFAACNGKTAGDACSVAFERGNVDGSCMAPRHADAGAERLLCAPAHPHGHQTGTADAGGK